MRPYYFEFEPERTRRTAAIVAFERMARGGRYPAPPRRCLSTRLADVVALVRLWRRRSRERAQLAALSPQLLRDIGITPSEARREAEKPFWQA